MVTNETTVSQLIELGIFTQKQIDQAINRFEKSKDKTLLEEQRIELKSKVLEIIKEIPDMEYKNGDILKLFGFDGVQNNSHDEQKRIDLHKEISRVLTTLTDEGILSRLVGANSAQTSYILFQENDLDDVVEEEWGDTQELHDWLLEDTQQNNPLPIDDEKLEEVSFEIDETSISQELVFEEEFIDADENVNQPEGKDLFAELNFPNN